LGLLFGKNEENFGTNYHGIGVFYWIYAHEGPKKFEFVEIRE